MRAKVDRAALLAAAPASVRQRNAPAAAQLLASLAARSAAATVAPAAIVAPPAPGKRPRRGSARPVPQGALPGALDAAAGVVVELPGLRLVNPLNQREHWRSVSARGKREKAATAAALRGRKPPALPVVVTITRVSPGRLDSDGAVASAKHVRDSVATWLGCDDGDDRVLWVVTQAKGAAGVRIAVGPRVTRRAVCPSCGCDVDVGESEGMR